MLGRTGARLDEMHGPRGEGGVPSGQGAACLRCFSSLRFVSRVDEWVQASGVSGPWEDRRRVALSSYR